MRFQRSGAVAALVVVLSVGAAACGSGGSTSTTTTTGATGSATPGTAGASATTAAAAAAGTISIKNFSFHPDPATAKVGDTITVTNNDTTQHTVTADDGSFDTKAIDPGASVKIKVTKAGSIAFHCNIHQFMKGSITVSA